MIKVMCKKISGYFESISIQGHAASAEAGKDLVCAGVSAVTIGALNALAEPKKFTIRIAEGDVLIKRIEKISKHDEIVLETLIIQLQTIEQDYSKFIKVNKF